MLGSPELYALKAGMEHYMTLPREAGSVTETGTHEHLPSQVLLLFCINLDSFPVFGH